MTDPDDMEDVFKRSEKQGIKTETDLMDWMKKDQNGEIVRSETPKLKQFVSNIAEPWNIEEKIDKATASSEIEGFDEKIKSIQMEIKDKKEQLNKKYEKRITELITDEIEALPDDDVVGVKKIVKKHKNVSPNIIVANRDVFQNYAYNAGMVKFRELRDSKDANGLENLKSDVSDLDDGSEIIAKIDEQLAKLKGE